ncbi:glycosyltransferase [Thalassotalea euphylliae]|uniref:glycosyltransferase n=1 Tax=Thalassotalea euphylliae TaxID=1655234 RepID=UPI00363F820E
MLSIVIANFNGEKVLQQTLDGFCNINFDVRQQTEILFVDNGSTDQSIEIALRYQDKLPLKIFSEPKVGKGYALAKGIKEARGEFVIFADNDVIPNTNWLIAYERAASHNPEFSIFLGAIRPHFLISAPQWLKQLTDNGKSFGCTPVFRKSGPAEYFEAKGANFGVRKCVLEQVSFRDDLWIANKAKVGGEDTDFVKRAQANGFRIFFDSEAEVEHIVRANEVGIIPVVNRYFRIGRSIAATTELNFGSSKTAFGYPLWAYVETLKKSATCLMLWFKNKRYESAEILIELSMLWGKLNYLKEAEYDCEKQ